MRPAICFIPGGPGLSSATLRSMDVLSRSFDLVYVDTPGTAGLAEPTNPTFFSIAQSIENELVGLERDVIMCGHSFGALFAAQIAQNGKLRSLGLIAIAAPFSSLVYEVACKQYELHMTNELRAAAKAWSASPSQETLKSWLASYGLLYFSEATLEKGRKLLLADQVSAETFRRVLPALSNKPPQMNFIAMTKALSLPKLMIAGEQDLMLPPEALKVDADAIGAKFIEIKSSGHFVTFDQPDAVAGAIETEVIDSKWGIS
jgi:pimeloyl-ACP methyl ester carboxylesterase